MRHNLSRSILIAFLAAGLYLAPVAAAPPELRVVRVPSRTFDEFHRVLVPTLAAYRQVVLEVPRVEFAKNWLRDMNRSRGVSRRIEPTDATRIADDMALAMHEAIREALSAQGYEVVDAGGGALRVSPSISDLQVNAPFVPAPGIDVGIVRQDVGQATLRLDVYDAATGKALARFVDRRVVRTIGGYDRATSVSNLFWFEGVFRRWAKDCIDEIPGLAPQA